eukprot:scaffold479135_cov28-Prasinocladus_malaysianus.AAC.1
MAVRKVASTRSYVCGRGVFVPFLPTATNEPRDVMSSPIATSYVLLLMYDRPQKRHDDTNKPSNATLSTRLCGQPS